ncbi:MAG: DUF2946 family protein [Burkholderiales bacterium]|nr:DUF2946 family protein [Burkholderiales bacterium]
MDDIVLAALKKWPNVPHCHGWLALDARGDWYLRDEAAQHAGPFPRIKGSRIEHTKLRDFIARNYAADAAGCWYFQNGPQRVYVQLEVAPWVWRVHWHDGQARVSSHTGQPATVQHSWLDEQGRLFLATTLGFGLVHSADMGDAVQAIEAGHWSPGDMASRDAPARFGFVLDPQPGS